MNATNEKTKLPVEDLILFAGQDMSEGAWERFTQGEISQAQLKDFYETLKSWTAASEIVLGEMNKVGIQA